MSKVQQLNAQEVKEIFGYVIENNKELVKNGKMPVAIGLEGESGIGKTSVLRQLAEEKGMDYLKLNLSQITVED